MKSLGKHVCLLISIIFFSKALLHGGEMTVMDSKVIETQQVFEEIVLKAVSKGNLQSNKVVGVLNPEISGNVRKPRYIPVMENALLMILAAHTRLANRSILAAIDEEQALMLKKGEASFAGWSSPQKVVHLLVWEINPIRNMKGGLKWLRKDTNPKKS